MPEQSDWPATRKEIDLAVKAVLEEWDNKFKIALHERQRQRERAAGDFRCELRLLPPAADLRDQFAMAAPFEPITMFIGSKDEIRQEMLVKARRRYEWADVMLEARKL